MYKCHTLVCNNDSHYASVQKTSLVPLFELKDVQQSRSRRLPLTLQGACCGLVSCRDHAAHASDERLHHWHCWAWTPGLMCIRDAGGCYGNGVVTCSLHITRIFCGWPFRCRGYYTGVVLTFSMMTSNSSREQTVVLWLTCILLIASLNARICLM